MFVRRVLITTTAAVTALAGLTVPTAAPAAAATGNFPGASWSAGVGRVHLSSPTMADVNGDGIKDVVVGDLDGKVSVLDGRNGGNVPGWPQTLQIRPGVATAIEAAPTVADLDHDGSPEVIVAGGSLGDGVQQIPHNQPGGVEVFNSNGSRRWARESQDVFNMWTGGGPDGYGDGVASTPAVGDVDGDGFPDLVYGSFDHQIYAVDRNGADIFGPTPGCPPNTWCGNGDTIWSSPALYDYDYDGRAEIFVGGDASGYQGCTGGWLRALHVYRRGQVQERWRLCRNEIFQSSPVIGDIDGDGRADLVIGTGTYYKKSDTTQLMAVHADDGSALPGWPVNLNNGPIMGTPALGDVDGDGVQDVVVASCASCPSGQSGTIWALRGNGTSMWSVVPTSGDEIISSPALVDLDADGVNDVVLAKSGTIRLLKGQTGANLFNPINNNNLVYQNAPAIGDIGGGNGWKMVVAGRAPGAGGGTVTAFPLPVTPRAAAWPMFHRTADHAGAPGGWLVAPTSGYWLTSGDGGIFSFGTAAFYGSTGGIRLNQPIVGMTPTPNGQGYWLVASDGGIFAFGNAGFYGSAGGIHLNQPIVGMAATPSGRGYWLVASDGGIFAYGDAAFAGSTGGTHLNQPIVGMAASGANGYWLVARDGGIFAFGAAPFLGSAGGSPLNRPIVGMAKRPGAMGYWLVASDGGIFSYGNAPFFGSTGGMRLNLPIVGIAPTGGGDGYRLMASDGGIFAFGNAPFWGSAGGMFLNRPVIAGAAA